MRQQLQLEVTNKLFLELSQVATAKTKREEELEDLLRSAQAIAERRGAETAWARFSQRLTAAGIHSVTPKIFKLAEDDDPATA